MHNLQLIICITLLLSEVDGMKQIDKKRYKMYLASLEATFSLTNLIHLIEMLFCVVYQVFLRILVDI